MRHGVGQYPVYIGAGLVSLLPDLLARHLPGRRPAVIADEQVSRLVRTPLDAPCLTFPAGEGSKTRESWARLSDELLSRGFGRDSAIVALGGGVTGDLAGFVAATFLRGVPVLQVPTTLLAMVDSAVGGKSGVDTPAGKNLIGAFHPPAAVVMDPQVLMTLPDRECRNGLAEAVKHAAIADAGFFQWLGTHAAAIRARDPELVEELVRRNVAIKSQVVAEDEHEQGRRAVLNAGHTVAHALEAASGYRMGHGEAVAIGLVVEALLGQQLGITQAGTAAALTLLLDQFGLPTRMPEGMGAGSLIQAMATDKKNRAGLIRMALLERIGAAAGNEEQGWTTAVTADEIARVV